MAKFNGRVTEIKADLERGSGLGRGGWEERGKVEKKRWEWGGGGERGEEERGVKF